MRTYPLIPTPPTGAELNPARGLVSVIVPEATTNLIVNPSPQRDSSGYSLSGAGLINRVTTTQRRGVYCLECVPSLANSGVQRSLAVTSGQVYTFSADVKGLAGRKYYLQLGTGTTIVIKRFVATGRWQRIEATITATAAALIVQVLAAGIFRFWTDGWQVENKPYATTYVDGSLRGLTPDRADYYWTGTPYASTSGRLATTRTGGRMLRLDTAFGFRLAAIVGLSALLLTHQTLPLATGGSVYQGSQFPAAQTFTLSGVIESRDPADLDRKQSALNAALSPLLTPDAEPATLVYHPSDGDRVIGDDVTLLANWTPAGGEIQTRHQARVDLEFSLFVPMLVQGGGGDVLAPQSNVSVGENVLYRSPTGQWQRLGTNISPASVQTIVLRPAGGIYAGALSGNFGGTIPYLAQWTGSAWSLVGISAPNGAVNALAVDAQGRLYAAGAFTSIGGIAANRIARFDPATNAWTALVSGIAGGASPTVFALAIAPNGDVYVGGLFSTAGGVPASNIAKYTPATGTWAALGSGTNNQVEAIVANAEGQVFVGGTFTAAGGVAGTNKLARWNPGAASFVTMASGVTVGTAVYDLVIGPDNRLYVLGDFSSIGSVTAANGAIFNGFSYEPLGAGTNALIRVGGFDRRGHLYVGGDFTQFGNGDPAPDGMGRWIGGALVPLDVDVAGAASIFAVVAAPDGGLYVGGFLAGTSATVAAGLTTVVNAGKARTYPTIELAAGTIAATRLSQIRNETTGKALYFNYTMQPGERITLRLKPDEIEITSSFRGNILGAVKEGSQLTDMYLLPGDNVISLFLDRNDVTATIQWPTLLTSLHDAAWR